MCSVDQDIEKLNKKQMVLVSVMADVQLRIHEFNVVKPLIAEFQAVLFNYFQMQSKDFFEKLRHKYQEHSESMKQIDFLENDLIDCKVQALTFFDKHPCDMGDTKPNGIGRDFIELTKRIKERFHIEKHFFKQN